MPLGGLPAPIGRADERRASLGCEEYIRISGPRAALLSLSPDQGGLVKDQVGRAAELRERLWGGDGASQPSTVGVEAAILEQYKLYVEMADRVSQRRALANTFFLSLNTAILTLVGVSLTARAPGQQWWLLVPLVALLGECFAWYYLVRSYRLLNAAKYEVVGALEERLPASPYWRAEWWALGEGRDPRRYWPLSHIEQWVPLLFAATYVAGFAAFAIVEA